MEDGQYKGAKFIGIIGHESVSHNGSKTTVYFLQVQVDNAMFVVKHRYHDFKDFYDKVRTRFCFCVDARRVCLVRCANIVCVS